MVLFAMYTCGYLLWGYVGSSILGVLGVESSKSSEETLSWEEMEKEMAISEKETVLFEDLSPLQNNVKQMGYISPISWRIPVFEEEDALRQWMKLSVEGEAKELLGSYGSGEIGNLQVNTNLIQCIEVYFSNDIPVPAELSEEEGLLFRLKLFHRYKTTCLEDNGLYYTLKSK